MSFSLDYVFYSIRLVIGCAILGYASFWDVRERKVGNYVWTYTVVIGCLLMVVEFFLGGPGPVEQSWVFLLTPLYTFLLYVFIVMDGGIYPTFDGIGEVSEEDAKGKPEDNRRAIELLKKHSVRDGIRGTIEYLFLKGEGKFAEEEKEFEKLDVSLGVAMRINEKHHRINRIIFVPVILLSIVLIVLQTFLLWGSFNGIAQLMAPAMVIIGYVLYRTRLLFGGADAKALMSLGVMAYYYPELPSVPILSMEEIIGTDAGVVLKFLFPFALVALVNAVLLTFSSCIILFIGNALKGDISLKGFLGWRVKIVEARRMKYIWLMEIPVLNRDAVSRIIEKIKITEMPPEKMKSIEEGVKDKDSSDEEDNKGDNNRDRESKEGGSNKDVRSKQGKGKEGESAGEGKKESCDGMKALMRLRDDEESWRKIEGKYLKYIAPGDVSVRTAYFTKRARISDEEEQELLQRQLDLLEIAGRKSVWVTPQIPFMVPLLLGWLSAFVLGNIMFWGLYQLLDSLF